MVCERGWAFVREVRARSELLRPWSRQPVCWDLALLTDHLHWCLCRWCLHMRNPPSPRIPCTGPLPLVLADARFPAVLAQIPDALMLAYARSPVFLAHAPLPPVLAETRTPAVLWRTPFPLVLADAGSSAFLALVPTAPVLEDSRSPAILYSGAGVAARVSLSTSRVGLRRGQATASPACLSSHQW